MKAMTTGAPERVERRLAGILAADVASYSRLMGADEEGTLAALKAIRREVVDPTIGEHRGRIVKTTGELHEHAVTSCLDDAPAAPLRCSARCMGETPGFRL